jgi:hypothetical protein
MERHGIERRFYYIEDASSVAFEPVELYTIEDAKVVAEQSRKHHPEQELTILEFEVI